MRIERPVFSSCRDGSVMSRRIRTSLPGRPAGIGASSPVDENPRRTPRCSHRVAPRRPTRVRPSRSFRGAASRFGRPTRGVDGQTRLMGHDRIDFTSAPSPDAGLSLQVDLRPEPSSAVAPAPHRVGRRVPRRGPRRQPESAYRTGTDVDGGSVSRGLGVDEELRQAVDPTLAAGEDVVLDHAPRAARRELLAPLRQRLGEASLSVVLGRTHQPCLHVPRVDPSEVQRPHHGATVPVSSPGPGSTRPHTVKRGDLGATWEVRWLRALLSAAGWRRRRGSERCPGA